MRAIDEIPKIQKGQRTHRCLALADFVVAEWGISALCEACKEFSLHHGLIVTEDHEEEIQREDVTIQCSPFWKWAQVMIC